MLCSRPTSPMVFLIGSGDHGQDMFPHTLHCEMSLLLERMSQAAGDFLGRGNSGWLILDRSKLDDFLGYHILGKLHFAMIIC